MVEQPEDTKKPELPRQDLSKINESADCNLSRSDKPATQRLSALTSRSNQDDRIVYGGVTGKSSHKVPTDPDVTKIMHGLPNKPELKMAGGKLALSNTVSTVN